MSRRLARETAMQFLYEMEINSDLSKEYYNKNLVIKLIDSNDTVFINNIINTYIDNKEEVDTTIESNLNNWKLDRLNKVELSILRLAVTEIKYIEDIPNKVSINEAVEISKRFCDDESYVFINGVLGEVLNG
ncbi:MAG: transcription antitermination factor NusB [Firmicutes bacterium]|jgi:N utilization substance protein B|nr:transcription antitermination factor NusB [Bacillota bacterium]